MTQPTGSSVTPSPPAHRSPILDDSVINSGTLAGGDPRAAAIRTACEPPLPSVQTPDT